MTAKEYLSKIKVYYQIMESYAQRIEVLYSDAAGLKAIVYDKDRVQITPSNQLEQAFVRIDAMAAKYAKARMRYEREVDKRIRMISALDNAQHIQILKLRYIDGLRWEEIACRMNYSFRHVTRLHGEALRAFSAKHHDVLLCPKGL